MKTHLGTTFAAAKSIMFLNDSQSRSQSWTMCASAAGRARGGAKFDLCRDRTARSLPAAANLLLVNLECVAVLHFELFRVSWVPNQSARRALPLPSPLHRATAGYTHSIGVVLSRHTLAVEEEAHARNVLSLAVAEGVHELAERRCALDLEEDLVVVVGDLDVEVLRRASILWLVRYVGRSVIRHDGEVRAIGAAMSRW